MAGLRRSPQPWPVQDSGAGLTGRISSISQAAGLAVMDPHPAAADPSADTASEPNLHAIVSRFAVDTAIERIEPLGNGNVNATWRVVLTADGGARRSLVLQRLNRQVFRRPDLVMANIERLGAHLQRPEVHQRCHSRWEMPALLPLREGSRTWLEQDGDCWRLSTFIASSRSCDTIDGPDQARELGRALGTFHALIHDLPTDELADTLEGFHVAPGYLAAFERELRRTSVPLTPQAQHCIAFIRDREAFLPVLERARQAGRLQLRPIHGDPKINNILFAADSDAAIALIDLDTVKPGLIHYDIGDCLRSGCNRLGEETEEWRAVQFDLELCEAILLGYLAVAHPVLSDADYEHIPDAIRLLSLELGLRFFSDHLAGDVYFRTSRPRHNLQRALVQFRLTESIETQMEAIRALVSQLRRQADSRA